MSHHRWWMESFWGQGRQDYASLIVRRGEPPIRPKAIDRLLEKSCEATIGRRTYSMKSFKRSLLVGNHQKAIAGGLLELFPWLQNAVGEGRLVGSIWEILRLQAEGFMKLEASIAVTAVEEIPGV